MAGRTKQICEVWFANVIFPAGSVLSILTKDPILCLCAITRLPSVRLTHIDMFSRRKLHLQCCQQNREQRDTILRKYVGHQHFIHPGWDSGPGLSCWPNGTWCPIFSICAVVWFKQNDRSRGRKMHTNLSWIARICQGKLARRRLT